MRALSLAALLLAGCTPTPHLDARIVEHRVLMPVPVYCDAHLTPEPAFPDTDAALAVTPNIFTGSQALMAARAARIARLAEVTAAYEACRGPGVQGAAH